ncbi:SIN3-HDAC complex-associated factor [Puma concolor]|uniref:SIN3-HDAC complex-associated factor n=1 Tax=Puma concolor TaxID=9696 RepID=A0A6P6II94_PUMCO|nr:SIN3-HDAC complex-associated factor [Puma concolor]
MFGFHKPKMYRSIEGCCICRAKSSSSRFTDSKRYEKDFQSCFGLHETRSGDICNACVLLVKRWKKLPAGSKKNWNHVVDARAGPSLKTTLKPKKVKTLSGNRIKSNQISKLQKEFKRHNSDAHSTTSSASPAQSPCYSNQSDDGSDTEMASGSNRTPVFSFLDLTYWKRQKICCGIIYKGHEKTEARKGQPVRNNFDANTKNSTVVKAWARVEESGILKARATWALQLACSKQCFPQSPKNLTIEGRGEGSLDNKEIDLENVVRSGNSCSKGSDMTSAAEHRGCCALLPRFPFRAEVRIRPVLGFRGGGGVIAASQLDCFLELSSAKEIHFTQGHATLSLRLCISDDWFL